MGTGSSGRPKIVILWAVVLLLAAAIRLWRLDHFSYWLDEIFEAYWIRDSWQGLWQTLRSQLLQAPLDYSIVKLVETLGPSDAGRKVPAVLWGVGCVAAFGALVGRRAGPVNGFVAGFLLALAPYHVRYSQELRPYSLGMFLLCVSLYLLDAFLERPSAKRLLLLFLASVATAYCLFIAALVLILAGSALVIEDCFAREERRREAARKFLRFSPLFAGTIAITFLPWWSVLLRAIRSPPFSQPPTLELARAGRVFSYFGFGPADWYPLGRAGFFFVAMTAAGALLAAARPRLRFLLVWAFGGLAVMEILEHRHPTYDSIFHFLPAGMALTALFALPVGWLLERRRIAWLGGAVLVLTLWFDAKALNFYFERGRADWRPLARFLRTTPSSERIFTDSQYTQLCVAFYVVGPDWLCCQKPGMREIVNLDGKVLPLSWAWEPGENAWLVIALGPRSEELKAWSAGYPSFSFPTAEGEGGAVVRHLVRDRR